MCEHTMRCVIDSLTCFGSGRGSNSGRGRAPGAKRSSRRRVDSHGSALGAPLRFRARGAEVAAPTAVEVSDTLTLWVTLACLLTSLDARDLAGGRIKVNLACSSVAFLIAACQLPCDSCCCCRNSHLHHAQKKRKKIRCSTLNICKHAHSVHVGW